MLIGVPVALTASQRAQQWATTAATTASFAAGLVIAHELSRSVDPFTPLVAWALPGIQFVGTLGLLTFALTATTWLRWRSAIDRTQA